MVALTRLGISALTLKDVPRMLEHVDGQKSFVEALEEVNVAMREIIQITSTLQTAQMLKAIQFQGDIAHMTVANALQHWGQFCTHCIQGYQLPVCDSK